MGTFKEAAIVADPVLAGNIIKIKTKFMKSFSKKFCLVFSEIYENKAVFCVSWDQFLVYDGRYYQLFDKRRMQRFLSDFFDKHFIENIGKFSLNFLNQAYDLLKIMFPRQIEDTQLAHDYFAFEDGLYNTATHEAQPHTPAILVFKFLDVEMKKFKDPSPNFDRYFLSTFVSEKNTDEFDPDLLDVYQEMCGSLLSGNGKANRAFFLWGKGANGKSVTTEFLFKLYQEAYTSAASLETLSSRFGKARLTGKILNVCSEEESKFFQHDIFKALVTGEKIDAERKNESGFAYHSYAKLIFATNNFPKFSNLDFSTKRRVVIIPFNRTFTAEERDHNLTGKLLEEKSQFVNFALNGLKRLQENNFEYSNSAQITEAIEELEAESSSPVRFWRDEVIPDPSLSDSLLPPLTSKDIYPIYQDWCKQYGFKAAKVTTFAKQIAALEIAKQASNKKVGGTWKYYILEPRPWMETKNPSEPPSPI